MNSLPELHQALNQLGQLLSSSQLNNALFRNKHAPNGRPKAIVNPAASAVFGIAEILAHIFLFTLPSEVYRTFSPNVSPLSVSQVCKFWRNVAVGFPHLWSSFALTFEGGKDSKVELFTIFLDRSGNLPLSVKLVFGESRGSRIAKETVSVANRTLLTISQNHFHRLRDVYLVIPPECGWFTPALLSALPSSMLRSLAIDVFGNYDTQKALEDFRLQSLVGCPQLKSLLLLNHTVAFSLIGDMQIFALRELVLVYDFLPGGQTGERTRLNSYHCLSVLRCCPSLERLCISLHWSAVAAAANANIRILCSSVEHDKLKKLCIIAGDANGELDAFLGHLILPCLYSFELRSRSAAVLSDGFHNFMGNGSMLEEVALLGRITPVDVIVDRLAILPNLRSLTLIQLPHIGSFLQALSYRSADRVEGIDERRICRLGDLESLTIEARTGTLIPLDVMSHFIRSRRWFDRDGRAASGTIKINHSSRLKLLRVPASQSRNLFEMDGVRECVMNGLRIEQYEVEHTPAYLSGKDFFHL